MTWEAYRDYNRLGRRSRLREPQRLALWKIFSKVIELLEKRREMTVAEMFTRLAEHYAQGAAPPFDFAVVETKLKTSAWLNCGAWVHWAVDDRTHSSSRAIQVNDFRATVFVEVGWCRSARPIHSVEGELPNLTSDSRTGRPFISERGDRRRWEC